VRFPVPAQLDQDHPKIVVRFRVIGLQFQAPVSLSATPRLLCPST
jgi:hypothetical protein